MRNSLPGRGRRHYGPCDEDPIGDAAPGIEPEDPMAIAAVMRRLRFADSSAASRNQRHGRQPRPTRHPRASAIAACQEA